MMKAPKLRFSVSELIRKLAFSNSSIWAIHFRAENVISREIDGVVNLWQIFNKEKQMRDAVVKACLSSG